MKKQLILVSVLLIAVISLVHSQNQNRVERRVQQLKEFLSLTDDQTAKVKAIMMKSEGDTTAIDKSKPLNRRSMMRDQKERFAKMDKEIEALLTAEQLKKYESYKLERMNQMRSREKGRKFKEE